MTVRIPPVNYESASAAQRAALDEVKRALGKVPNLYATIGQAPRVLSAVVGMQAALGKGGLGPRDRHLIDLHVSQLNGCAYCVSAHTVFAKADGLSEEAALRFRDGAGETPRDAAILALARRVTRTGGAGAGAELAQAREAGLSDPEIVEVVAAAGIRSLINAIAIVARTEVDWPKAPRIPEG
jgi:uncharacterized peroxidase-related enzyme